MHTVDAQTWSYATEQTETKLSKLRGRDRGGNSLSAKQCSAGMYSRLFAHVTWLAIDQRAVGHRWRGPERCGGGGGWICWERGTDEWKTRWAALIRDRLRNFDLCWRRLLGDVRLFGRGFSESVPKGFPAPVGGDETLWQRSYFTHVIKWSIRFCGTGTL